MDNINPNKKIKNINFSGAKDKASSEETNECPAAGKEMGREALGGPNAMLGKSQIQKPKFDSKNFDPKAVERIRKDLEYIEDAKTREAVEKADALGQDLYKKLAKEKTPNPYGEATDWEIGYVDEFADSADVAAEGQE